MISSFIQILTGNLFTDEILIVQIRREMPDTRFRKVYTFNSARKSMSTIVPLDSGGFRVYTKGASEIIMKKCSFLVGKDGVVESFNTQMQERLVQVKGKKKSWSSILICFWGTWNLNFWTRAFQ